MAWLARDGDLIEVDAGEYRGDVAVWTQDRLRLRAAPLGACAAAGPAATCTMDARATC